jgi:hypothetical protein
MGKTNEDFDRIFREKLENHQESPSSLAWKKLESSIPGKKTRSSGIWWAVAAGISIFIVSGWLFWVNTNETKHQDQLAENLTKIENTIKVPSTPEVKQGWVADAQSEQVNIPEKTITKLSPKNDLNTSQTQKKESKSEANAIEENVAPLISAVDFTPNLPSSTVKTELKMVEQSLSVNEDPVFQKTVAEVPTSEEETNSLYRVRIYSDGLKKGTEPGKNLLTEMGKTVGKVEGLLEKVDEGFVELQDKKNSLFAGLTSKKQQVND